MSTGSTTPVPAVVIDPVTAKPKHGRHINHVFKVVEHYVEGVLVAVAPFLGSEVNQQVDAEAAKLLPPADAAVVDQVVAADVVKVETEVTTVTTAPVVAASTPAS